MVLLQAPVGECRVIVGDLFSGIGGFSLAARWMGWRTAWFSEVEPFACRVLAHHWPGVPNLGDIRHIDFTSVPSVDILVGGFPCQDISHAGKKEGITGSRSKLWKEYARAIRELRPRYIVVENVAALVNRGLDVVLGDLAESGYDAEWRVYGANHVGAPQRRSRCWILGYPNSESKSQLQRGSRVEGSHAATSAGPLDTVDTGRLAGGDGRQDVAHTISERGCGRIYPWQDAKNADATGQTGAPGTSGEWWATEPAVGRLAHGIPNRLAQLRGLGNSIVPQCAIPIYVRIQQLEAAR